MPKDLKSPTFLFPRSLIAVRILCNRRRFLCPRSLIAVRILCNRKRVLLNRALCYVCSCVSDKDEGSSCSVDVIVCCVMAKSFEFFQHSACDCFCSKIVYEHCHFSEPCEWDNSSASLWG